MSILIRGVQIPENCNKCPCYWNWGYYQECQVLRKTISLSGRREDCPLVEIPTHHGRLIDEKELYDKIEREFDGCCVYDVAPYEAVNDFEEIVDQCKTIIEAEE